MRMKKLIVSLLLLVFLIPSVVFADVTVYDVTVYVKTALTGSAGALDSIDGTGLVDGDLAFVFASNVFYTYRLDDDSGAAESSPSVIAPDANGGNKRWILQNTYNSSYSSISGTPAQYQWGEWVNATTIKGTAVTGSKVVCTDANGSPVACTNLTDTAVDLRGYIAGLGLSNAADADHDITIAAGTCRDSTNAYTLTLASALTKQIDAAWAEGNNAGGMFTGVVGNNTWYHLFLIRKDSNGALDAGWDTSLTAANRPAGWTSYRLIRSHKTDGSANIIADTQEGDCIFFNTAIADLTTGSDRELAALTLSVPPRPGIRAIFNVVVQSISADASGTMRIGAGNQSNPPTINIGTGNSVNGINEYLGPYELLTSNGQIYIGFAGLTANVYVYLLGYIDERGRNR
jgi:hypothetical protein